MAWSLAHTTKSHRAAKRRQAEADRQAPPAAYAANEFFSGAGWSATAVMRISKRHGVAEAFWHERVPLLGRGNGKGKGHRNPNRFGKTASRSSARERCNRSRARFEAWVRSWGIADARSMEVHRPSAAANQGPWIVEGPKWHSGSRAAFSKRGTEGI